MLDLYLKCFAMNYIWLYVFEYIGQKIKEWLRSSIDLMSFIIYGVFSPRIWTTINNRTYTLVVWLMVTSISKHGAYNSHSFYRYVDVSEWSACFTKKSNETSIRVVDAEYWLTSCELGAKGSHGNRCVVDRATGASGSSEQQLLIDFTASDDAVALVIWICKHMLFVLSRKYHIDICSALGLYLYPRLVCSKRVCFCWYPRLFHKYRLYNMTPLCWNRLSVSITITPELSQRLRSNYTSVTVNIFYMNIYIYIYITANYSDFSTKMRTEKILAIHLLY